MDTRTVSIIGCGASAVTFIRPFVELYIAKKLKPINLLIFEPSPTLGVGLAYQDDLDDLIINRPAQTMSCSATKLEEFYEWVTKTLPPLKKNNNLHTSRKIFGNYLEQSLEKTLGLASQHGIRIKIIRENVITIEENQPFLIKAESKKQFCSDYILLSTGHNKPKDIYALNKSPKYIHHPYPMSQTLCHISANEHIGIIGNSLTAIDTAISLQRLGRNNNITMLSRSKFYSPVRAPHSCHKLSFLTSQNIQKLQKNKKTFSLREALRLFRKELKKHHLSWKFLFTPSQLPFELFLEKEIQQAKTQRSWQTLLFEMNQVVEKIWHGLDFKSKNLFLTHFHFSWIRNRSPIPLQNAQILLDLIKQKKLAHLSGLKEIKYDVDLKKYIIYTSQNTLGFDWIINASGPARYIQQEDQLLYQLIQQGIAREHSFGGVQVDFDTAALINTDGKPNLNIRVLGHNTSGVYYYTSSLEMIARKATVIAHDLINIIEKDQYHVQTRRDNTTHTHLLSHFT